MTKLAVIHPTTLLARELRERLDTRPMSWHQVQLFSPESDEAGTLTEIAGGAAVVQAIDPRDPEPFSGIDIAFFCGPIETTRPLIAKLSPETKAVILSPGASPEDAPPEIPSLGLGGRSSSGVGRATSPPPGAIFIAHLAAPLSQIPGLDLRALSATLIEPASTRNEPALHELFEQGKRLLTFAGNPESPVLGGQWAFNLGEVAAAVDANVLGHLDLLLGKKPVVSVHGLHAGVFHGMAGSFALDFAAPVAIADLRAAWAANPAIEFFDGDAPLGPVHAAQSEMVLLAPPRLDSRDPRRVWVWATMDNLTRGGAINALEIAESLLAS